MKRILLFISLLFSIINYSQIKITRLKNITDNKMSKPYDSLSNFLGENSMRFRAKCKIASAGKTLGIAEAQSEQIKCRSQ